MAHSKLRFVYLTIGLIEIGIGFTTFIVCSLVQFWGMGGFAPKPLNVFFYVVITSLVSTALGLGVLRGREWAIKLLIYFSGYIVLNKLLLYAGLLTFSGQIMTIIPRDIKEIVSFCYHLALVVLLLGVRKKTCKN